MHKSNFAGTSQLYFLYTLRQALRLIGQIMSALQIQNVTQNCCFNASLCHDRGGVCVCVEIILIRRTYFTICFNWKMDFNNRFGILVFNKTILHNILKYLHKFPQTISTYYRIAFSLHTIVSYTNCTYHSMIGDNVTSFYLCLCSQLGFVKLCISI